MSTSYNSQLSITNLSYNDLLSNKQTIIFNKLKTLISNSDIDIKLHTEWIININKYNSDSSNNITISGRLNSLDIIRFEELKILILGITKDIHFKISYEDENNITNDIIPSSLISLPTQIEESNLNIKSSSQFNNFIDNIVNFLNINALEFLNITIIATHFYTSLKEYTAQNIYIKGVIPTIYEPQYNQFTKLIIPYLSLNINTKFLIYLIETGPIPLISQVCSNCTSIMPFYICIKCSEITPTAFCYDCYENHENSNGNHIFLKLHSLATNLNTLIFTNNTSRINYNACGEEFNCFCDGCGDIITECRWKCANCPDFDLCNSCVERWEESAGTFYPSNKAPSVCFTPVDRNSLSNSTIDTTAIKSLYVKTSFHPRGHCFLFMKKNYSFNQVDEKEDS